MCYPSPESKGVKGTLAALGETCIMCYKVGIYLLCYFDARKSNGNFDDLSFYNCVFNDGVFYDGVFFSMACFTMAFF